MLYRYILDSSEILFNGMLTEKGPLWLMSGGHSGHFLLMNVPANHGVEAQTSQWLPCKGRWPNEKIYLASLN